MARVVALDIGERRIGVAVSDPLGLLAQPLTVLTRRGGEKDLSAVIALLQQWQAEEVVVGLPYTLAGEEASAVSRIRRFVEVLRQAIDIPIVMVDERLSTTEAERRMQEANYKGRDRRTRVDAVAAALILERYLRKRGGLQGE